jgi:RNA polymerase sigma-70 factor, ECF subfamily
MRIAATMPESHAPSQPADRGERDERQLLVDLSMGDRSAADELVERTYEMIYGALHRLTGGDRELAADLTQEAYRRAWTSLAGFKGRSRFSTWLYRIAYTTFLNHIRRPRRVVPMEEAHARTAADPAASSETLAMMNQQGEQLRRAVLELDEPLREVVTARYWGEVPVREIAGVLGLSQPAVRKRLKKALTILDNALEVSS